MTAYILYNNGFDESGITVTSDDTPDTDYPIANGYDYKLYTGFRDSSSTGAKNIIVDFGVGNTFAANAMGIISNETFPGEVRLHHSTDGSTWTALIKETPSGGSTKRFSFERAATSPSYRYWRATIANTTTTQQIVQCMFGQTLTLRPIGTGFNPPVYQHKQATSSSNRNGNYLGNIVKNVPQDLRIRQQGIDPDDFRTDWVPFLEHARSKPFFFVWDYENRQSEVAYCWADKPMQPAYSSLCHMSIDLRVKAVFDL